MNIKSTPIDAQINFNMRSSPSPSTRAKEPKEQNLDPPDLPPPFLDEFTELDEGGVDEAGPSRGHPSSSPPQGGSSSSSAEEQQPRSALSESSFLHRHREDVLCGPCGLELFVDTPSHTGTVMLTSQELMLWRGRSFLLHIWAGEEAGAEASNGKAKTSSAESGLSSTYSKLQLS